MKEYLLQFEKDVLIKLFENVYLTRIPEPVPLKKGKIHNTAFGNFIESAFEFQEVFAIDYYGLFKISTEIIKIKLNHIHTFPAIKIINSPVIHFSSVKKEQVQELAPDLYNDFDNFKKHLVHLRWNK